MSDYTARDWQNGEPCPAHKMPYCTPCFKALIALEEANPYKKSFDDTQARMDNLRETIMKRIADMSNTTASTQTFYRPRARNFFEDSRRKQFAASCQLEENFLVVPIEFAIIGDSKTAHKADEAETRAILTKEHLWDTSTPEWLQQDTTLQLDDEDAVLLREFQLFRS